MHLQRGALHIACIHAYIHTELQAKNLYLVLHVNIQIKVTSVLRIKLLPYCGTMYICIYIKYICINIRET
jgi:hypothetical protein